MSGNGRKSAMQQVEELLGIYGRAVVSGSADEILELATKPKANGAPLPTCAKCGGELVELVAGDGVTRVQVCPACTKGSR